MPTASSSKSAYIHNPGSSIPAFLTVGVEWQGSTWAYLVGGSSVQNDAISAYLTADVASIDNLAAYLAGAGGFNVGRVVSVQPFVIQRTKETSFEKFFVGPNMG